MTRDDLEAAIWRAATYHSDLGEGTSGYLLNADQVDTILRAVDAYAATEVGLLTPAERRRVLHGASPSRKALLDAIDDYAAAQAAAAVAGPLTESGTT